MNTEIFILDHDAFGLFQRLRSKQRLSAVPPGSLQQAKQVCFFNIRRHGQALCRADIQAGVAFDTQIIKKHRLDIAIQTTLDLLLSLFGGKAQLNLGSEAKSFT